MKRFPLMIPLETFERLYIISDSFFDARKL